MKVLFLGETYRPDAQTWIRGLKTYGNCEVISWELPKLTGSGARLKRIAAWVKAPSILRKLIKVEKPDIILAYRVTSYGYLAAKCNMHPYVVAQQGVTDIWPQTGFSKIAKTYLGKVALKNADLIHAWGEVMVPAMMELGADPKKIKVLAKGVDTEWFKYDPTLKTNDKLHAVVTRTLAPDYRHDVILTAIKEVKAKGIPIRLEIIGDGPLLETLKDQAKSLGLTEGTDIIWHGRLNNSELGSILSKCNLYLSMPISEGVSASLFEAMACGLLPIVTDLPANRAWIKDGENGYLIPEGDSTMLALRMEEAWKAPEWIVKAAQQNRFTVEEKADMHKNLPQFVAWYKELIHQAKS